MTQLALQQLLPELVVLVGRDGVVLDWLGGREVAGLIPRATPVGRPLEGVWPEELGPLLRQLVRRAIGSRSPAEAHFRTAECAYGIRVRPQGPGRAICVIGAVGEGSQREAPELDPKRKPSGLERRGFLRRFRETMAEAALREKPTAVAVLYLDGLLEVARIMDTRISEQVVRVVAERVSASTDPDRGEEPWSCGPLGENALALVIPSADRGVIEARVLALCELLCEPVRIGDAAFHLTPYTGVAILGQDGSSPRVLLENARAAAVEAQRGGTRQVCFFSDTLELRSLARLDLARELTEAIEKRQIDLRYVGRYDLTSGRLLCHVGYMRWRHPLRGDVRPAEFVGIAESTGLAVLLSRGALSALRATFTSPASQLSDDARISFGALRHHLLHPQFADEICGFLTETGIAARRLELRISERTFTSVHLTTLRKLSSLGVQLVVDEVGRGLISLDRMARAPLAGVQLDRSWTSALDRDPAAARICGAGIGMALALGLTPIATGVDDLRTQQALRDLGCEQGMGDLYG
jgi:predicted signal transduction protein with EAL and GGDEF domain